MHSKIITLSLEPVVDSLLGEDELVENGFVPWIADYADSLIDDDCKDAIIQDWISCLGKAYGAEYFSQTNQTVVFHKGFKMKFFITMMERLQKEMHERRPKSLDDYKVSDFLFLRYRLESLINDRHGLYIYSNDMGLQTAYDFYESLTEEIPYYFGNVVDYHF